MKQASENKREFDEATMKAGQSMIGLQYGTNKGASQAGMTPYGASRQIRPEGESRETTGWQTQQHTKSMSSRYQSLGLHKWPTNTRVIN